MSADLQHAANPALERISGHREHSMFGRVLRESPLHFAFLGALIFAAGAWREDLNQAIL